MPGLIKELLNNKTFTENYKLIYDVVKAMGQFQSDGEPIKLVANVYDLLAPMALTLAFCFCILEILSTLQRTSLNNATPDILILPFVKFAACALFINFAPTLIGYVLSASNAFFNSIDDLISKGEEMTDALPNEMGGSTTGMFSKIIFQLLPAFISLISQVIACILIGVQMVSLRIEMMIRFAVMPFAIASIAHGGAQSPGMKFIKNLVGNFLTIGAIILAVKFTFLVAADASTWTAGNDGNVGTRLMQFLFMTLLGPFAAVGVVATVKSVIKEVFS